MRTSGTSVLLLGAVLGFTAMPVHADGLALSILTSVDFVSGTRPLASLGKTGGGSCDNCVALQTGLDTGAVVHRVEYDRPDPEPDQYTNFTGQAGGEIGFGYLRGVVTGALVTTRGRNDAYGARLVAFSRDEVTILPSDPALLGTRGTLTASLQVDQEVTATVIASETIPGELAGAQANWILRIAGSTVGVVAGDDDTFPFSSSASFSDGTSIEPAPTSISLPFTIGFTFGESFELYMEFEANASGIVPDAPDQEWTAASGVNFLNTVTWQGISSLVDSQGNPVAFNVQAASGTNWQLPAVVPVPVPPALWLLATGLVALLSRRRPITH